MVSGKFEITSSVLFTVTAYAMCMCLIGIFPVLYGRINFTWPSGRIVLCASNFSLGLTYQGASTRRRAHLYPSYRTDPQISACCILLR
ncbi:hypothetical protein BDU57DRAFT_508816 [Ampelomyces quisqualis]|uniref:Uncharacterized protein n=1 Tax=Ampelomyces quisqualis TaxID=50730 RepID=A0A6A5QXG6_AMPQU|nr:hypothetical protein BDU57DRAFT_508816 [Ampelomyces quisqualis]